MIQDAYFSDGIWRCYNCSAVSHTISEFVKLEYHGGRLVKIVDYKIHPELVRHSMDRACILCGEKCSQNSELRTHYKKKHNALVQSENTFLLGMSTQDMSCCHVWIHSDIKPRKEGRKALTEFFEGSSSRNVLQVQDFFTGGLHPLYKGGALGELQGLLMRFISQLYSCSLQCSIRKSQSRCLSWSVHQSRFETVAIPTQVTFTWSGTLSKPSSSSDTDQRASCLSWEAYLRIGKKAIIALFAILRAANQSIPLISRILKGKKYPPYDLHRLICWCLRLRCCHCDGKICSTAHFTEHVESAPHKHMAERWILRNVEAPSHPSVGWKCRSCSWTTSSFRDMLEHMEIYCWTDHPAAFCCLYCAKSHHTRNGIEEHTQKHSTSTLPQKSPKVCFSIKHLDTFASERNPQDAARLAGLMIAQDLETGATLSVYSGHHLGEINRLFTLLQKIMLCDLPIQYTACLILKAVFWLQVQSEPVPNATTSEVTITMTIKIIWRG